MRELKCHSVIHCGFKKLRKKKNTTVAPPEMEQRGNTFRLQSHGSARSLARSPARPRSLFLSFPLQRRHYPSLVSDTHLAVALIIVFEGTIITGKVVPESLFEMSQTMRSDKDKFSTHAGVRTVVRLRESRREFLLRAGRRTFCAAYLPLWFCLKRGNDTL